MSDDLDNRLTMIANEARASVVVARAEIERALADVTSGVVVERSEVSAQRRLSATAWAALAAAVVLVLGGGIWLATRGDEQLATVTPASTAPSTAPASSTMTSPAPATAVSSPPASSLPRTASDPFAGFTRVGTGIERVCGGAGCTRLVADLDGVVHSCDPSTATVTRHANPSASVTLVVCPFVIGPGGVAYSFEADDTGANYVAARSLLSGDELQRVSFEGADADLVPTPAGLTAVGLVMPSIPQPDLTKPPAVPWVLPEPGDAREFAVGVFEPGDSPAISVGDRRWVVGEQLDPSVSAISGIVATDDGGFLAVAYSRQTALAYLVRGRPDGSTAGIPIPIDDPFTAPALLERSGTVIVPAGDTFVRIDPLEPFVPTTAPPTPDELTVDVSAGLGGWNVEGARIARTCAHVVSDLDGSSVRRCTQLVVDPSGILVTYDPVRRVLTRERSEAETVTLELPDEFDDPRLLAAGPDGVVYVELANVWPEPSDVIAVALVPGDAGRVIERWDGVLPVGDLDVLASSNGLVVSGWYETGPRPSIDRAPIVPWITRDGSIITAPTLLATFDDAKSTVSANGWMWSLAERSVVGDQPGASWIVPTFDGGFLALYSQTTGDQRAELIRGWRNGVLEYAEFPMSPVRTDGSIVLEPQGTVLLRTTDGYLRVAPFEEQPTGWTGGLQVDPTSATATALGLDAFLDTIDWPVEGQSHVWPWGTGPVAFANAVAGPASSAAEVRTIEANFTAGDEVAVSVTIEGLLDDSVYGVRYVMLITWVDGPGFRIERIDWANSCQPDRGHQDYSSELCV